MSNTNREASLITYFNQAKTLYMYKTLYDLASSQGQTVRQELKDAPTQHLIARIWGQSQLFRDGQQISQQAILPIESQQQQPQLQQDPRIVYNIYSEQYYNDGNPILRLWWQPKDNAIRYTIYDKSGNIRATTTNSYFVFRAMTQQEEDINQFIFGALKPGELTQFQVIVTFKNPETEEITETPANKYYSSQLAIIYKPNKAVTKLNIYVTGDKSLGVTWSLPDEILPRYPIEYFTVQYSLDNTFSVYNEIIQPNFYGSSTFTVPLNGLNAGEVYYVRIKGVNAMGDGPYDITPLKRSEDSCRAIGIPIATPQITKNIVRTAGKGNANITWSNVGTLAYPVTEYVWAIHDNKGIEVLSGTGPEQQVLGFRMKEGIRYTFRVRAKNDAGTSIYEASDTFIYYLEPGVPDIRPEYKNGRVYLYLNYSNVCEYIDSPISPIKRLIVRNLYGANDIVITGQLLYQPLLTDFEPELDKLYTIKVIASGKGGDAEVTIPIQIVNPFKQYIKTTALIHGDNAFRVSWTLSGGQFEEILGYRIQYINLTDNITSYIDVHGRSTLQALIAAENGKEYSVRISVRRYTAILYGDITGDDLTNSTPIGTVAPCGAPYPPILGNHIVGIQPGEIELKWTPQISISGAEVTGYKIVYASGAKTIDIGLPNSTGVSINGLINHSPYTFSIYTRGRLKTDIDSVSPDEYIYSDPVSVTLTPYSPIPSPTTVSIIQSVSLTGIPIIDISWAPVISQLTDYKYRLKYIVSNPLTQQIHLSGEYITSNTYIRPTINQNIFGYNLNVQIAGIYTINDTYISKTPYSNTQQILPPAVTDAEANTTSFYFIRTTQTLQPNRELARIEITMDTVTEHLKNIKVNGVNYPYTFIESVNSLTVPFNDDIMIRDVLYKLFKYQDKLFLYVLLENTNPNSIQNFIIEKQYERDNNLIYYSPAKTTNNIEVAGIIMNEPTFISATPALV